VRYLDTSSLVALYYPEAKTTRIEAHLHKRPSRLPLTWLHELEFINSLQLKVFRGEGTETAVAATLAAVRADLEAGAIFRMKMEWAAVFAGGLSMSAKYSSELGTRTLDLLHVSAASLLGAREFITSDQRQAIFARREGLKTVLIT
jgi:predicted nucleic acid-binding protein